MRKPSQLSRRTLLASLLALSGCDRLVGNETTRSVVSHEGSWSLALRNAFGTSALAREFQPADVTKAFKANGSVNPDDDAYQEWAEGKFAEWRLEIDGLVERPAKLSLEEIRALPSRTQITRHDCVEGWSCIGKWKGARLSALLESVGVKPEARYVMFRCADALDRLAPENKYYESIDLAEARHEQTILAYEMNDEVLPVRHGAPLRLRVERQLGYKMAKYIMRIELVADLAGVGDGNGGYWEDLGYDWYAGI